MSELSHLDKSGQARMVDVGDKTPTRRSATAAGRIVMSPKAFQMLHDKDAPKGDVMAAARIAAISAAKKTADLIPLCHILPLESVSVSFTELPEECALTCSATATTTGKTGVEMEALVAVQVGLLTIYDMLKAVDRGMSITDIRLIKKTGGKSGDYVRNED